MRMAAGKAINPSEARSFIGDEGGGVRLAPKARKPTGTSFFVLFTKASESMIL